MAKLFKFKVIASVLVLAMLAEFIAYAYDSKRTAAYCKADISQSRVLPAGQAAKRAFNGLNRCIDDAPGFDFAVLLPSWIYECAWPLGQELEAAITLAHLDGTRRSSDAVKHYAHALQYYWDDNPETPGYDATVRSLWGYDSKYYDDNNWIAIALMEIYRSDHSQIWALHRAEEIFVLLQKGASDAAAMPNSGGVMWTQKDNNPYRATVSTAGAVQVALRLYQITHEQHYLSFALQQFQWVDRTLRDANGLYMDGLRGDGSRDESLYTYNQGLMLGDAALFYVLTGDQGYLLKAKEIAADALAYFTPAVLADHDPIFNAIFLKNLLLLDSVAPNALYHERLHQYAVYIQQNTDPNNGLFLFHGGFENLKQAAAIQVLAMDAIGDTAYGVPAA